MYLTAIRRNALALAVATATLSVAPLAAQAETIKLTTQDWSPYQTVENGQLKGLAVKSVTCVIEKMGHKADISVLPWVRAQKDVADGAAAGFFAASKSADRDAFAEISQLFIPQVWLWYVGAGKSVDVKAPTTKVGVLAGSGMEKWLDSNGYAGVQKLQTTDALIKMLQGGRIDAVLTNEIVFKEELADMKVPESAFSTIPHSDKPMGVYFGKAFLASHAGFMDAFNAKIAECK